MKKVRVLNEFLDWKIGCEFDYDHEHKHIYQAMVNMDVLEWVEEEKSSLQKTKSIMDGFPSGCKGSLSCAMAIDKNYHDHYKELYNKATKDNMRINYVDRVCKEIFGEE